jgi:tetratricopeptide (TPR) repeat protein/acyl carrier protein
MAADADAPIRISAAEQHLLKEEYDDALRVAKQALQQGPTDAEALRVSILAQCELAEGDVKSKQDVRIAEDSLANFRKEGDKKGEALMLLTLAELSSDSRGAKRRARARDWALEAIDLLGALQHKRFEALAWLALATMAAKQQDREELLNATGRAMALFAEMADKRGVGICQMKVATAHLMKGDSKAAIEKLDKALGIFRALGEQELECSALRQQSQWQLSQEKPEEALESAKEALKIAQMRQSGRNEVPCLLAVANAHFVVGDSQDAIQVVQDAVERHMSSGNQEAQLRVLELLVNVLLGNQSYSDALDASDQALDLAQALNNKHAEMRMLLSTYEVYYAKEDMQSAMDTIKKAQAIAQDIGDNMWESRITAKVGLTAFCTKSSEDEVVKMSSTVKDIAARDEDRQAHGIAIMMRHAHHAVKGELEEALTTGIEAQEIFQDVGDHMREALTWYSLSEIHIASGKLDAALYAQEQSLHIWKQLDDRSAIIKALFGLAELHLMLRNHVEPEKIVLQLGRHAQYRTKDELKRQILFARVCLLTREKKGEDNHRLGGEMLDKALRAVNKALRLLEEFREKPMPIYRGMAYLARAEVLVASGMYEQATAVAEEAKRSFVACKDSQGENSKECGEGGEALVLALIGTIHLKKGELREANRFADDAVRLAVACQDWKAEHRCSQLLSKVEEAVQSKMAAYAGHVLTADELADMAAAGEATSASVSPVTPVAVSKPKGIDAEVVHRKVLAMMTDMFISDDDQEIHLDTDVLETGLDSLSSLDLVGQLSKEFKGVHLSPTLLFDFPTIREIGKHVHEASLED